MRYFDRFITEPEVTKEFRKLSKENSPRTLEALADKSKTELMQEINKQRSEALRRISIAEGREASYYEELLAKGVTNASIWDIAAKIDQDLSAEGNDETSFEKLFGAVSEKLFGKKMQLPKNEEEAKKLFSGDSSAPEGKKG